MIGDPTAESPAARSTRLKFFTTRLYGLSQPRPYQDAGLAFVRATNVERGKLVREGLTFVSEEDLPESRAVRLQEGDIIVVRSGAYTGDSAFVTPDWVGGIAGFDIVVRTTRYANPRFVAYALLSPAVFEKQIRPLSSRAAQPHLNAEELGDIEVSLPRVELQRAIADYLDRETARLDALVAAKERVLGLLAEKRRALITRAVTRGLDPNAPLRDSGIPWLGEIPAHWEVERARWLFRERDVRSDTGDEELLTVSHLTGVTPRSEKDVNMFEAETNEGYKICHPSDLVINTLWAWMGAMGVAPVKGIVSPAYNVYQPGERLESSYVDAVVRLPIFAQEVTRYSKGVWSSRLRLYPEGFFEVYLPVPHRDEQRAIADHIGRETGKLDAVRDATERTIALLKERRAALIAAAVTGQIDVDPAA